MISRLEPSRFSTRQNTNISSDGVDSHFGDIRIQTFNTFLVFGLTPKVNLLTTIPFLDWNQEAEHEDNHHRTESIRGFGDIVLGVRWLYRNQSFGPGTKLFFGTDITLPSGESYKVNPFSEGADSLQHRHFALGKGVMISSLYFEWWYRSEFPLVLGASGRYDFPWTESNLGYEPGQKVFISLHIIRQTPVFKVVFPYLRANIWYEKSDSWEGVRVVNSGGTSLEGMIGIEVEISEKISAVLSLNTPVWRKIDGSQLDQISLAVSLRALWHHHQE
ncbi:MAG: hypothetical protein ACE5EE_02510 [Fidelibacterota bacterium]